MRRGLVLAVSTAVLLCLTGMSGAQASDPFAGYVTKVTAISPVLPGVSAKAAVNGAYIVVTNSSATPVVVYGYQDEPYLRISSKGVWENVLSPATYLNKEQFIDSIPKDANADKAPRWKKLTSADSMRWHDHRIHWMDAIQPPAVAAAPDKVHLIKKWTIPVSSAGHRGVIRGTLSWHPSSHVVSYLTYGSIGVAVLVVLGLGLLARRRRTTAVLAPVAMDEK